MVEESTASDTNKNTPLSTRPSLNSFIYIYYKKLGLLGVLKLVLALLTRLGMNLKILKLELPEPSENRPLNPGSSSETEQ